MKRFILACLLCSAMLVVGAFLLMPAGLAKVFSVNPDKENVVEALLNLPAPPPPNPLEQQRPRDESFYDPKNPPADNAPIEDLVDYWTRQSQNYRGAMYFRPKPSERVVERLISEAQRAPDAISAFLNVLPDDKRTSDLVIELYERREESAGTRDQLKHWLTFNSDHFVGDLERVSARTHDSGGYVNVDNENNLLALTRWDWERARPIVDRMYADTSQPVTRVLATWALYKHALLENDSADIERYRNELMRTVENRSLPAGIRDKANDAITHEADFPGRDDWAFSLFEDETWVSLPQYTGLTTLILKSPPDKYTAKLIDLSASKNKIVRAAAVRCLLTLIDRTRSPEIIRALLPWLEDPKWVDRPPDDGSRMQIVSFLYTVKMPESVPGLIAALDEKATRTVGDEADTNSNTNTAANVVRMAVNSNRNANANVKTREETFYPLRDYAVRALATQADPRAVPALRRLLATSRDYGISEVMRALQACGGFSTAEQVDALEDFVRKADMANEPRLVGYTMTNTSANAYYPPRPYMLMSNMYVDGRTDAFDTKVVLGMMVASAPEPSDVLARAVVDRIEALDAKDPQLAHGLRRIVVQWHGLAVSALFLRDLKNERAESETIVRLLSERKLLREKLAEDIGELHNGSPFASGISACLTEEPEVYDTILDEKNNESKMALLACARLIRAPLTLSKVEPLLKSPDQKLKNAAELYLESEDSQQARALVLARHQGEAKILGATAYFNGLSGSSPFTNEVISLFGSVSGVATAPPYVYGPPGSAGDVHEIEARLQKEVKEDTSLLGIYSYQENLIRIYKDKVIYSWNDDPSRYHERNLKPEEFANIKDFLTANHVDQLKPFLSCFQGCGVTRELLMLGRNGGSRVYLRSDHTPEFFAGLEKIFGDLRAEPAAIKYALSKDVPGLELLFASNQLNAETVWKRGSDIRVIVSNAQVLAKVEQEVSEMEEAEGDNDTDEADRPDTAPEMIAPSERIRIRRQYEGYSWAQMENGQVVGAAQQPNGVEYIPTRDSFEIQPDQEQWKARTAASEIRADSTGLYKISAGKITKLKPGNYSNPVVSANGRWLIVNKFENDEGEETVRYDLATNREYKIQFEGYGNLVPRCFIPAVNKFLMISGYFEDGYYEPDEEEASPDDEPGVSRFQLLDPTTGIVTPAAGEMRPLSQQTFRALQPTGVPNESWAALTNRGRNETVIGTYDTRLFRFKPLLKLPKISFGSMDMWVDGAEGKVYFVYSGHLLSIPLQHTAPAVRPTRRR